MSKDVPNQKVEATTEKVDVSQKPKSFMEDREALTKGNPKEIEAVKEDKADLGKLEKELDKNGDKNPILNPRYGYEESNRSEYERRINNYLIAREYNFIGFGKANEESIRSFTKELVDLYKEFGVRPPSGFYIFPVIKPLRSPIYETRHYTYKGSRIKYSAHPDHLMNRFRNKNKLILEKIRSNLRQRYGLEQDT